MSESYATADDGCRLWTCESGSGTPLVMCHGGPGLWDMFEPLATMLADRVRMVRWDQRGCGRSEHRGPFSVARSVADLDAVCRHLELTRPAVLGHSWGATLALRYALDHPDRVGTLVYVSGVGLGWSWHAAFHRNLAARLRPHQQRFGELEEHASTEEERRELTVLTWSAEFADTGSARRHAEDMATPWLGINYQCNTEIQAELKRTWHEPELVAECAGLTVPVLIVDGAADIRPRSAIDSLERALPNVTRVVLPAGHLPWIEDQKGFRAALLDHLDGAVPG